MTEAGSSSPDPRPGGARAGGAPPRPESVSELAHRIQTLLEREIGRVWVEGEASNVRVSSKGHCYFVLKDEQVTLNAVCFRGVLSRQPLQPRDGMKLELRGRVAAYTPRSEYQIIVDQLREAGVGELMRRFLELKERLQRQGLFDAARKRPIPRLPRRVAVVTSRGGAALRDILNILRRRARGIEVLVSHAQVQGTAAPADIVRALERVARHGGAEVVIVGRGGGSIEDLWAFNDERVIRAIVACPVPVIAAVGHETDTTLTDFAADLRAPTPSAAAEMVCAEHGQMATTVRQLAGRLTRTMRHELATRRARLERCRASWGLRRPPERVQFLTQRSDELGQRMRAAVVRRTRESSDRLEGLRVRLLAYRPVERLRQARERLTQGRERLNRAGLVRATGCAEARARLRERRRRIAMGLLRRVEAERRGLGDLERRMAAGQLARGRERALRLRGLRDRLASISPLAVLQRGYSIVTHGRRQRVVTDPEQVKNHEVVRIRSAGGEWRAVRVPEGEDLFE